MLPAKLIVTLCIALAAYFILILLFLKHRAIELRYTLLWIFSGIAMGIMILFPQTFRAFINLLGITGTMNGLFIFFIGMLIMICMSLTSIVSRQANKLRTLTQELAILEKRIRELEEGGKTRTHPAHSGQFPLHDLTQIQPDQDQGVDGQAPLTAQCDRDR